MELYYLMDGNIPPGYDFDAYLAEYVQNLKEEQEYDNHKKTNKKINFNGEENSLYKEKTD